MFFGFEDWIGIAFFSLLFAVLAFVANKTLGQRDKVKSYQKEVKDYQTQMQKALQSGDEKKIAELKKNESEVNNKMLQMVLMPWKASIVTLPLAWILVSFVLPAWFKGFVILLPFDIHLNSILSFTFYSNIFQTASYGTTGFFIVCAIFFGLILEVVGNKLWPSKG